MDEPNPPAGGPNQNRSADFPSPGDGEGSRERSSLNSHHIPRALAFGIIIVLSIAAGYLVWAKSQAAWPYDNTDLNAPLFGDTRDRENSDLAGWKTYRNEEYGFELEIPNNMRLLNAVGVGGVDTGFYKFGGPNSPEGTGDIAIDFAGALIYEADFSKKTEVVYGNNKFDETDFYNRLDNGEDFLFEKEFSIDFPDWYRTTYKPKLNGASISLREVELQEKVLNQILSTFKFINPTAQVDTSNWKTYLNEEFGFEFRYPEDGFVDTNSSDYFRVQNYREADTDRSNLRTGEFILEVYYSGKSCQSDIKNPKVDVSGGGTIYKGEPSSEYLAASGSALCAEKGNKFIFMTVSKGVAQILSTFKFIE